MRTIAILFRAALVVAAIAYAQNCRAAASWVDTNFVSSPTVHLPSFIPPPPSIAPARGGAIASIAPMPDGRIYVGGVFTNLQGRTRWGLARLQPNGAIDDSFEPTFFAGKTNLYLRLFAEPEGGLLVQATYWNTHTTNLFVRISATDEVSIVPNPGVYNPLVIQPDGKIIALAASSFSWRFTSSASSARVVRLNEDLSLDTTFKETTFFSVYGASVSIGIQPDGRAVLWTDRIGDPYQPGSSSDILSGMLRMKDDGAWDSTVDFPDGGFSAGVVFPDGKIWCRTKASGPRQQESGSMLLTSAGISLPGYGMSVAKLPYNTHSTLALGLDGHVYETVNSASLTRFSPEGMIDPNFAFSVARTNASGFSPSVEAIAALPDGSILVGGSFDTVDGLPRSGIVRLKQPDAPTNAVVEFVTATNFFAESTLPSLIVLKRTGDTNIAVNVGISRIGGTAGPGDFSFIDSVTFQPGELTNAIATAFPYDGIGGNDRTALLSLQTSTEGASVGVRSNQFIHLVNRELGFLKKDGDEVSVLEGSTVDFWKVLEPMGTVSTLLRVFATASGIGYSATDDFPTNWVTGAASFAPLSIRLPLRDNPKADGERVARMDLSFTNFQREPDLRLLVTNLSVFVRILDDDSPAGARLGLTNASVSALPLPSGQVAVLGGSKDVCILGKDLVRGIGFAATGSHSIASIAAQPTGMILAGGSFSNLLGSTNVNLVRLDKDLELDPSFSIGTGPKGSISKVFAYPDGRVLVSGAFTTFSGLPVSTVARLGANGAVDASLNISNLMASPLESGWLLADGSILVRLSDGRLRRVNPNDTLDQNFGGSTTFQLLDARASSAGKVYVAQSRGTVNGVFVTNIMRLTSSGQRDTSFNPGKGAIGSVSTICPLPDGRVAIGGSFSAFNDTPCSNLVVLKIDGTLERAIAMDGEVRSLELLMDGTVLIGGSFQNINGFPRRNVARIAADGTLLPQTPALLSEPIAAGQRVHLRTEPGMRFHLQSSPDLVNWTTTTSFTATAYSTALTNTSAAPGEARFLRAIANP